MDLSRYVGVVHRCGQLRADGAMVSMKSECSCAKTVAVVNVCLELSAVCMWQLAASASQEIGLCHPVGWHGGQTSDQKLSWQSWLILLLQNEIVRGYWLTL